MTNSVRSGVAVESWHDRYDRRLPKLSLPLRSIPWDKSDDLNIDVYPKLFLSYLGEMSEGQRGSSPIANCTIIPLWDANLACRRPGVIEMLRRDATMRRVHAFSCFTAIGFYIERHDIQGNSTFSAILNLREASF